MQKETTRSLSHNKTKANLQKEEHNKNPLEAYNLSIQFELNLQKIKLSDMITL